MSTKYPFPSHVSVQSFVTVKLSDKRSYGLWKTQMLRLLESHDMLGFIHESRPAPVMKVDDHEHDKLWNRSDALVHGWILASLSEQAATTVLNHLESKLYQQTQFTAKDIWDQVQRMYGQQAEREEERKRGVEGKGGYGPCGTELMKTMKEKRDRSRSKQELYHAVECGKLEKVMSILKTETVEITESISVNGNTALHIAMAYNGPSSDVFLESMLNLGNRRIPLEEIRNSDGSTLLHLAVSHGNTNAAKKLLDRSPGLFHVTDNQGCTPFDIALSQPWNKETCLFLMQFALPDIEQQTHTETISDTETLVDAISYRHFDLALTFIQKCNSLKSSAILLTAIAQNCPADFTPNQLIIYELLRTPVFHFITRGTSNMKGCKKLAHVFLRAVFAYPYKMLIWICMKLHVFKDLKHRMKEREDARDLLDAVCALIQVSNEASSYRHFYKEAMLEAIRRDASDVVEIIVHWFPEAALIEDEDGHNFAQAAWKNRASKVYALIFYGNFAKLTSLSQKSKHDDHCGNNFLHFAARLGPCKKFDLILTPPSRMQRELLWFKVAEENFPQGRTEKNCLGETPEMVFTKEHKDLEVKCEEWIKGIANSVAITATLIIAVMFAAVIQVPGGNNENGLPNLISQPAFLLFEISITMSATAASLSLLLFLVILTSPLTQDDFLLRVPLMMVIGTVTLFASAALGMLAFWAALFIIFWSSYAWILCLLAAVSALPVSSFFIVYFWRVSKELTDFMHSTGYFLIIYGLHRLKLVGRIFT